MNSPSNRSGHALSYVCRINHIPFISANHGVTVEISRLHGEISVGFDSSVGNVALCANYKLAQVASRSHFDYAKKYVVGMSNRHIAVRCTKKVDIATIPIIYVSYNIYRGNIGQFISFKTDYSSSIWEKNIINKVFSKLPYKVCYKTYPEETRRYADTDPVLQDIHASENITLLSDKVDMRYLTDPYSVLVSTVATSTLGWLVMSGKPVVFINQKNKGALTDDAYTSISKGIFVFDGDENNFHKNLVDFLSKPLSEIERLWEDKKCARKQMIKDYFTEYNYDGDAGKRAAKIITREYLT
jgi:hypothetical protein